MALPSLGLLPQSDRTPVGWDRHSPRTFMSPMSGSTAFRGVFERKYDGQVWLIFTPFVCAQDDPSIQDFQMVVGVDFCDDWNKRRIPDTLHMTERYEEAHQFSMVMIQREWLFDWIFVRVGLQFEYRDVPYLTWADLQREGKLHERSDIPNIFYISKNDMVLELQEQQEDLYKQNFQVISKAHADYLVDTGRRRFVDCTQTKCYLPFLLEIEPDFDTTDLFDYIELSRGDIEKIQAKFPLVAWEKGPINGGLQIMHLTLKKNGCPPKAGWYGSAYRPNQHPGRIVCSRCTLEHYTEQCDEDVQKCYTCKRNGTCTSYMHCEFATCHYCKARGHLDFVCPRLFAARKDEESQIQDAPEARSHRSQDREQREKDLAFWLDRAQQYKTMPGLYKERNALLGKIPEKDQKTARKLLAQKVISSSDSLKKMKVAIRRRNLKNKIRAIMLQHCRAEPLYLSQKEQNCYDDVCGVYYEEPTDKTKVAGTVLDKVLNDLKQADFEFGFFYSRGSLNHVYGQCEHAVKTQFGPLGEFAMKPRTDEKQSYKKYDARCEECGRDHKGKCLFCDFCRKPGHVEEFCFKKEKQPEKFAPCTQCRKNHKGKCIFCEICNKPGHETKHCYRREQEETHCDRCMALHSGSCIQCQKCFSMEHYTIECPCKTCGKAGHYENRCPQQPQTEEKRLKPAPAKLRFGTSLTEFPPLHEQSDKPAKHQQEAPKRKGPREGQEWGFETRMKEQEKKHQKLHDKTDKLAPLRFTSSYRFGVDKEPIPELDLLESGFTHLKGRPTKTGETVVKDSNGNIYITGQRKEVIHAVEKVERALSTQDQSSLVKTVRLHRTYEKHPAVKDVDLKDDYYLLCHRDFQGNEVETRMIKLKAGGTTNLCDTYGEWKDHPFDKHCKKISDVILTDHKEEKKFPTRDQWVDLAKKINTERGSVTFLEGDMGIGKTTEFVLILSEMYPELAIQLVLPSVELADNIHKSLVKRVKDTNRTAKIGKKINKQRDPAKLTVVTIGYLKHSTSTLVILDEIQAASPHYNSIFNNFKAEKSKHAWIITSYTICGAFTAYIRKHFNPTQLFVPELRKYPRYLIETEVRRVGYSKNRRIIHFGTLPIKLQDSAGQAVMGFETEDTCDYYVTPQALCGYNIKNNYDIAVVNFGRIVVTAHKSEPLLAFVDSFGASYGDLYQSGGRTSRHTDKPSFVFGVPGQEYQAARFTPAKMKDQMRGYFSSFAADYESLSKQKAIKTSMEDAGYQTFTAQRYVNLIQRQSKSYVKVNGKLLELTNKMSQNILSVCGLLLDAETVSATYQTEKIGQLNEITVNYDDFLVYDAWANKQIPAHTVSRVQGKRELYGHDVESDLDEQGSGEQRSGMEFRTFVAIQDADSEGKTASQLGLTGKQTIYIMEKITKPPATEKEEKPPAPKIKQLTADSTSPEETKKVAPETKPEVTMMTETTIPPRIDKTQKLDAPPSQTEASPTTTNPPAPKQKTEQPDPKASPKTDGRTEATLTAEKTKVEERKIGEETSAGAPKTSSVSLVPEGQDQRQRPVFTLPPQILARFTAGLISQAKRSEPPRKTVMSREQPSDSQSQQSEKPKEPRELPGTDLRELKFSTPEIVETYLPAPVEKPLLTWNPMTLKRRTTIKPEFCNLGDWLRFYQGAVRIDFDGIIMSYSELVERMSDHDWLEKTHNVIQVLLFTDNPSQFNSNSPILTEFDAKGLSESIYFRRHMVQSHIRFLYFLGFGLSAHGLTEDGIEWKKHVSTPNNHNFARITRFLRHLDITQDPAHVKPALCLKLIQTYAQRRSPHFAYAFQDYFSLDKDIQEQLKSLPCPKAFPSSFRIGILNKYAMRSENSDIRRLPRMPSSHGQPQHFDLDSQGERYLRDLIAKERLTAKECLSLTAAFRTKKCPIWVVDIMAQHRAHHEDFLYYDGELQANPAFQIIEDVLPVHIPQIRIPFNQWPMKKGFLYTITFFDRLQYIRQIPLTAVFPDDTYIQNYRGDITLIGLKRQQLEHIDDCVYAADASNRYVKITLACMAGCLTALLIGKALSRPDDDTFQQPINAMKRIKAHQLYLMSLMQQQRDGLLKVEFINNFTNEGFDYETYEECFVQTFHRPADFSWVRPPNYFVDQFFKTVWNFLMKMRPTNLNPFEMAVGPILATSAMFLAAIAKVSYALGQYAGKKLAPFALYCLEKFFIVTPIDQPEPDIKAVDVVDTVSAVQSLSMRAVEVIGKKNLVLAGAATLTFLSGRYIYKRLTKRQKDVAKSMLFVTASLPVLLLAYSKLQMNPRPANLNALEMATGPILATSAMFLAAITQVSYVIGQYAGKKLAPFALYCLEKVFIVTPADGPELNPHITKAAQVFAPVQNISVETKEATDTETASQIVTSLWSSLKNFAARAVQVIGKKNLALAGAVALTFLGGQYIYKRLTKRQRDYAKSWLLVILTLPVLWWAYSNLLEEGIAQQNPQRSLSAGLNYVMNTENFSTFRRALCQQKNILPRVALIAGSALGFGGYLLWPTVRNRTLIALDKNRLYEGGEAVIVRINEQVFIVPQGIRNSNGELPTVDIPLLQGVFITARVAALTDMISQHVPIVRSKLAVLSAQDPNIAFQKPGHELNRYVRNSGHFTMAEARKATNINFKPRRQVIQIGPSGMSLFANAADIRGWVGIIADPAKRYSSNATDNWVVYGPLSQGQTYRNLLHASLKAIGRDNVPNHLYACDSVTDPYSLSACLDLLFDARFQIDTFTLNTWVPIVNPPENQVFTHSTSDGAINVVGTDCKGLVVTNFAINGERAYSEIRLTHRGICALASKKKCSAQFMCVLVTNGMAYCSIIFNRLHSDLAFVPLFTSQLGNFVYDEDTGDVNTVINARDLAALKGGKLAAARIATLGTQAGFDIRNKLVVKEAVTTPLYTVRKLPFEDKLVAQFLKEKQDQKSHVFWDLTARSDLLCHPRFSPFPDRVRQTGADQEFLFQAPHRSPAVDAQKVMNVKKIDIDTAGIPHTQDKSFWTKWKKRILMGLGLVIGAYFIWSGKATSAMPLQAAIKSGQSLAQQTEVRPVDRLIPWLYVGFLGPAIQEFLKKNFFSFRAGLAYLEIIGQGGFTSHIHMTNVGNFWADWAFHCLHNNLCLFGLTPLTLPLSAIRLALAYKYGDFYNSYRNDRGQLGKFAKATIAFHWTLNVAGAFVLGFANNRPEDYKDFVFPCVTNALKTPVERMTKDMYIERNAIFPMRIPDALRADRFINMARGRGAIALELLKGGVEPNPGPTSSEDTEPPLASPPCCAFRQQGSTRLPSALEIKILLIASGIEPNPGPRPPFLSQAIERLRTAKKLDLIQFRQKEIPSESPCEYPYEHVQPSAGHVSKAMWNQMIKLKWNKVVIPNYRIRLVDGQEIYTFQEGEIPSYESLLRFCTCRTSKASVLLFQDTESQKKLEFKTRQTCIINALFCIFGRQGATRNSHQDEIAAQYVQFSNQFLQWLMDDLHMRPVVREEYINKVKEDDPAKAKKYDEAWDLTQYPQSFEMMVKTGEQHAVVSDTDGASNVDSIRPRCIMFNSYPIRAKCGALGYVFMQAIKAKLPQFFTAKNPKDIEHAFSVLKEKPHAVQWDWSEYDSTQTQFLRTCIDVTAMTLLRKIYPDLGDITWDQVYQHTTSMRVKVALDPKGRSTSAGFKLKMHGTTFSGHPTATTLFGTLRNISYALFAHWRKSTFKNAFRKFMEEFRLIFALFCSGDDGVLLALTKQLAENFRTAMYEISGQKGERKGLGLVAKKIFIKYKRFNFLSRDIALVHGRVIVLREIWKMLLTNSKKKYHLSDGECYVLAYFSLMSGMTEPLSLKMASIRESLAQKSWDLDLDVVRQEAKYKFFNKLQISGKASIEQACIAHGIDETQYRDLLDSLSIQGSTIHINLSSFAPQLKKTDIGFHFDCHYNVVSVVELQTDPWLRLYQGHTTLLETKRKEPRKNAILEYLSPVIKPKHLYEHMTKFVWQCKDRRASTAARIELLRGGIQPNPGPASLESEQPEDPPDP